MKLKYLSLPKIASIITFVISLSNCAYDFSTDSYTEIEQTNPNASINLRDLRDNQEFYIPTQITYNYTGNNKHLLYEVLIYIDDVLIESSRNNLGTFLIDTENLEDGKHTLKIEYIFSSGTGSLADISGIEGYVSTENYNIIVDKSPPEAVIMKSAEIINGSIFLSWEPISKLNFDKGFLVITKENGDTNIFELTKQQLLNSTYNDRLTHASNCGGGKLSDNIEYHISLQNSRGISNSNSLSVFLKPIQVKKQILNENQYNLTITQHALFSNFDFYKFRDENGLEHIISSNGGETTVDLSVKFPSYKSGITLRLYEETNNENKYKGCAFIPETYSKPFERDASNSYQEFIYNNADDFIYTLRVYSACPVCDNKISLDKRNPNDLSIINSKQIAIVDDYDNEELTIDPVTGNLIVDAGTVSFLIDKNSFSIIEQWELSDFGLTSGEIFYRNGLIVIAQKNNMSLYNPTSKMQFYTSTKTGFFALSESGRYYFMNDSIFEVINNSVNLVLKVNSSTPINLAKFIESSNLCIYNSYSGNPTILDLGNLSSISLNEFTGINLVHYDSFKDNLLLLKNDDTQNNRGRSYAYVYDFTTSNYKVIEVSRLGVYSSSPTKLKGYWVAKGKLIYIGGYYLDHYINE